MENINKSNNKELRKLSIMIIITLITQAVTLIKTSITAASFGATVEMDAFNFANSIGTFIFSFIGTGVTTVLIPAIINKKNNKTINNFITILYGISVICVVAVFVSRKFIVTTFSNGSDKFITITCSIMLITLLSQFFNTILGVFNAVFQCKEKFNVPKYITLATTVILTLLVILNKNLSIYEYAFYIFITAVLNVIIQGIFVYKYNFRYKMTINLKDRELRGMIKIFIPTVFSSGLYQISLLIDSMISSSLGEGQISILTYSNTIMTMINSLLIGNLMMYIYPKITKSINTKNEQKQLFDYVIFFNAIMFLMVAGFVIVGKDAISILYERGKFNSSITNIVYTCSLIYIIGLPINVVRDIIYRYFYAKGNTMVTFNNSLYASILKIIISIVLANIIGIYGIIIGTLITSIFSLTSILKKMNKEYKINIDKKYFIKENIKIIITTCITIITLLFAESVLKINNIILNLFVYGILTIIIYLIILNLFRSKVKEIKL